MGDSVGTSFTPELPQAEGHEQQEGRKKPRSLELLSKSYTPQKWMDDLEGSARSGGASSPGSTAAFFRYPLQTAIYMQRVDLVELTLGKGYAVNALIDCGYTPLQFAVSVGFVDVIKALLAAGADVTHRCSKTGLSALEMAIMRGYVDIARMVIEHGADVDAAGPSDRIPLHVAAISGNADVASMLLSRGADVDILDEGGWTPLQRAAGKGHAAVAEALLAAGADVSIRSEECDTSALNMAALYGHVGLLRLLVEHGADVNAIGSLRRLTSLHHAALGNKPEAIHYLVEAGANVNQAEVDDSNTALHFAADGNLAAVLALLKNGASVSKKTSGKATPLHDAATFAGTCEGTAGVVDLLLRWGADETALTSARKAAVDMIGVGAGDEEILAEEDVQRVRQLLTNAPADRAWRRRGFLVMCRAYYPTARVQLGQKTSHTLSGKAAKRTRSSGEPPRAEKSWAGVASMLMGAGSDPISLMGGGADLIFEAIVGYV